MSQTSLDDEAVAALEEVGGALERLDELDDEQLREMAALLDTLGHEKAADRIRPSRRGLLKSAGGIGAALITGGVAGSAATGQAAAGSQQTGTWGDQNNLQDVYIEDVYDSGDNIAMSFPGDGSAGVDELDNVVRIRENDGVSTIESKIKNNRAVAFETATYTISSTISVTDPGDTLILGNDATIDNQQTGGQNAIELLHSGSSGPKQDIAISNLFITGTGSDGSALRVEGTDTHNTNGYTKAHIENVGVEGIGGNGIELVQAWHTSVYGCTVDTPGSNGYLIESCHDIEITDSHSVEATVGVKMQGTLSTGCLQASISGGSYENCDRGAELGTQGGDVRYCTLDGIDIDECNDDGILLGSASKACSVVNASVIQNNKNAVSGQAGLRIESGSELHTIVGGWYEDTIGTQIRSSGNLNVFSGVTLDGRGDRDGGIYLNSGHGQMVVGGVGQHFNNQAYASDADKCAFLGVTAKNNDQDDTGTAGIRVGGTKNIVAYCLAFDTQGTKTQTYGCNVNGNDCQLWGNDFSGNQNGRVTDSGTRTVISGWGENSGDPSSTGDWNGYGYEGVAVVDTTNNTKYVYRGGSWV